ncbi:IS4 family transposase [Cohnella massiliensis]|uniref:IS4 family transposase n=1 Tax=Cohnella massiliensis TaxID=1816691 RepID=UPI0009BB1939|nr:IS4 family transposase [Cohnella massiliensis]
MGNIHQKTVMRKCLKELKLHMGKLPLADRYAKKLTITAAILLCIEGEIQQRRTLEDIQLHLTTDPYLQKLAGVSSVHASTLNRKLAKLPLDYLQCIFERLASRLQQLMPGAKGVGHLGKLAPIDSSSFLLPFVFGDWTFYQDRTKGVKMHTRLLCLDEENPFPDRIVLSTVGVSDQMAVDELVTRKDLTYILDRGYVNYTRFCAWAKDGITFVARLKTTNTFTVLQEHPVKADTPILRDATVTIYDKKTKTHRPFRLVEFQDEKGRTYRLLTNRFDLSAADVGEVYRCRWQIELFFKWIKQHLTTITFHNHDPTAVGAQLYLGVISYLLCQLVHRQTPNKLTLFNFVRYLRHYSQYPWKRFVAILNKPTERTSRGRQKRKQAKTVPRIQPGRGKNEREVVKILVP